MNEHHDATGRGGGSPYPVLVSQADQKPETP